MTLETCPSSRCHRSSVPGVTRNADHRCRGNSRVSVASTSRSDGVYVGRAICRCNTVSWCRRTAISTSFASGAGPIPSSPSTRRSSTSLMLPITPEDHATHASALIHGMTDYLHPSRTTAQQERSLTLPRSTRRLVVHSSLAKENRVRLQDLVGLLQVPDLGLQPPDTLQLLARGTAALTRVDRVCCVQRDGASVGSGRSAGHMASASSVNAVARRSGGETSVASS